ncbi:LAMI_0F15896g1_1 [Lachancea mirantina]|uniref:LAMI_0F15896g1_1 n=1 Tax=Lachancea mirantina TaxID=1230905 RepID=A0A1G4K4T9_9SACH|nr:LAMI_0F15896g1_1 [Lachancea mirantina]
MSGSLISRANRANNITFSSTSQKYWKYDWYSPLQVDTPAENGNGEVSENKDQDRLSFHIKKWIPTEKPEWDDAELEVDDVLDLKNYDRSNRQVLEQEIQNGAEHQNTTSGLSADDIRGAVGNEGGISGFSGSDAITRKEKEDENDAEDESAKDVEMADATNRIAESTQGVETIQAAAVEEINPVLENGLSQEEGDEIAKEE